MDPHRVNFRFYFLNNNQITYSNIREDAEFEIPGHSTKCNLKGWKPV